MKTTAKLLNATERAGLRDGNKPQWSTLVGFAPSRERWPGL